MNWKTPLDTKGWSVPDSKDPGPKTLSPKEEILLQLSAQNTAATVLFPPKVPAPVPVEEEPKPTLKVVPETSKMSKGLQEALFWNHNMSHLQSQTNEELRAMLEAINSHIQRLEEEIPLTSDDAARQEKVTDVKELKGYKQGIWEINYQRKHPVPSREKVSQQVVKAYLLMEIFQDTLRAERIEVEANTYKSAEER